MNPEMPQPSRHEVAMQGAVNQAREAAINAGQYRPDTLYGGQTRTEVIGDSIHGPSLSTGENPDEFRVDAYGNTPRGDYHAYAATDTRTGTETGAITMRYQEAGTERVRMRTSQNPKFARFVIATAARRVAENTGTAQVRRVA